MIIEQGRRLIIESGNLKDRIFKRKEPALKIDISNPPPLIALLNRQNPLTVETFSEPDETGEESNLLKIRFATYPTNVNHREFGHKLDNEFYIDLYMSDKEFWQNMDWLKKVGEKYNNPENYDKFEEVGLNYYLLHMDMGKVQRVLESESPLTLFDPRTV